MSLTPKTYEVAPRDSRLAAPGGSDPTHFLPKIEPSRVIGVVLRRGWIVMLPTVLGAAALYLIAARMP